MNNMLTVTQLCTQIKNIFDAEEMLHDIYIFGEVANFSVSGGNAFFSLRDEGSTIPCACFDIYAVYRKFVPKNGEQVILKGRPAFYVKGGKLTFQVTSIKPYGQGAIFEKYSELKAKLQSMGVFDQEHKKPIPKYSQNVGVVTSEKGAVLQDIINVSGRRNKAVNLTVYPVKVQGTGAAAEMVRGLETLDQMGLDVVILARGGGSNEDLSPFYDARLIMAVYDMQTPIITAVGHETDFTLVDYAADLRAPTPSAAAELAVYDLEATKQATLKVCRQMIDSYMRKVSFSRLQIQNLLDRMYLQVQAKDAECRSRIRQVREKLCYAEDRLVDTQEKRLQKLMAVLDSKNPAAILRKGYVKVYKGKQEIFTAEQLNAGDRITLRFQDGLEKAVVEE